MTKVDVRTRTGGTAGSVELADAVFGIEPNVAVMHQVVTAQLAARRAGTQSTKTRAEVRGGGKKPWRQKGTGRARQGSTRAPHWVGGGVALGPKPRSYAQKTPKKMITLALRSALSDRAADGKVLVVEDWAFDEPKTKHGVAALRDLGADGHVLIVLGDADDAAVRAFRNLQHVHLCLSSELNAYDVLRSDWVVFTKANLPTAEPAEPRTGKGGGKVDAGSGPVAIADSPTYSVAGTDAEGSDPAAGTRGEPTGGPADETEETNE